jgi:acyl-CoA synthetase (AMP-forming)/AMP-acid ligase II
MENPLRHLIRQQAKERFGGRFLSSTNEDRVVTFDEFERKAETLSSALLSWGAKPGDRFGLVVSDPVSAAQCLLGMMSMGIWVAPLDPTITYASIDQVMDRARAMNLRGVVADRTLPFEVDVAWLRFGEPETWTVRKGKALLESERGGGVILASSGTTGTPKVMELSTEQILEAARLVARHNQLTMDDVGFNPLPLWHINAIVVGVFSSLLSGASLVLDDRFHRTSFWATMERMKITWINAVPAIIALLTELQPNERVPPSIRFIRSASAPLSPAQLGQFEAATGIMVIESYGMTEAASQICANPISGPRKIGSVGLPIGVEVRISSVQGDDMTGQESAHEIGHVEIKGPSIIQRYAVPGYEDRFDSQGWLRTGDLGYFDDDGYLFLVGRTDDVINRGGEKILPRELEEAAMKVDGVLSAAVIGLDHHIYGQVPELFVQLRDVNASTPLDQLTMSTKELHDAFVDSFSRTRRPVSIKVVLAMPSHSTGKIQKKRLVGDDVTVLYQLKFS